MNSFMTAIRREPALVSGAILAILSLVTAFGLDISKEQVGAIMAVVSALMAIFIRAQVTPSIDVSAKVDPSTGTEIAGSASPIPNNSPVTVTPAADATAAPITDATTDATFPDAGDAGFDGGAIK